MRIHFWYVLALLVTILTLATASSVTAVDDSEDGFADLFGTGGNKKKKKRYAFEDVPDTPPILHEEKKMENFGEEAPQVKVEEEPQDDKPAEKSKPNSPKPLKKSEPQKKEVEPKLNSVKTRKQSPPKKKECPVSKPVRGTVGPRASVPAPQAEDYETQIAMVMSFVEDYPSVEDAVDAVAKSNFPDDYAKQKAFADKFYALSGAKPDPASVPVVDLPPSPMPEAEFIPLPPDAPDTSVKIPEEITDPEDQWNINEWNSKVDRESLYNSAAQILHKEESELWNIVSRIRSAGPLQIGQVYENEWPGDERMQRLARAWYNIVMAKFPHHQDLQIGDFGGRRPAARAPVRARFQNQPPAHVPPQHHAPPTNTEKEFEDAIAQIHLIKETATSVDEAIDTVAMAFFPEDFAKQQRLSQLYYTYGTATPPRHAAPPPRPLQPLGGFAAPFPGVMLGGVGVAHGAMGAGGPNPLAGLLGIHPAVLPMGGVASPMPGPPGSSSASSSDIESNYAENSLLVEGSKQLGVPVGVLEAAVLQTEGEGSDPEGFYALLREGFGASNALAVAPGEVSAWYVVNGANVYREAARWSFIREAADQIRDTPRNVDRVLQWIDDSCNVLEPESRLREMDSLQIFGGDTDKQKALNEWITLRQSELFRSRMFKSVSTDSDLPLADSQRQPPKLEGEECPEVQPGAVSPTPEVSEEQPPNDSDLEKMEDVPSQEEVIPSRTLSDFLSECFGNRIPPRLGNMHAMRVAGLVARHYKVSEKDIHRAVTAATDELMNDFEKSNHGEVVTIVRELRNSMKK